MKIRQSQLRQIIREEIRKIKRPLKEGSIDRKGLRKLIKEAMFNEIN